jgi:hypothetical protein
VKELTFGISEKVHTCGPGHMNSPSIQRRLNSKYYVKHLMKKGRKREKGRTEEVRRKE